MFHSKIHGTTGYMRPAGPRINIANHDMLRAEGLALVGRGARVIIIDLVDVEFIDSTGLGALVRIRKEMGENGVLEIANPNGFVSRVLKLTKLDGVFEINP